MIGFHSILIGVLIAGPGAPANPEGPGMPGPEGVKTAFSVLVGFPSTDQAAGSGVLLVPGTVIPLTDEPADRAKSPRVEKSLSFSSAAEKLWSTFRLDPGRRLQQGKTELAVIGKPVDLPRLANASVTITATLLRFDDSSAAFRVVFKQGDKTLADSSPTVPRGGRAVVGGMDGPAAPYLFVFVEPEAAATQASGAKSRPPDITEPQPVSRAPLKYPEDAKKDRAQGTVILEVVINETGDVLEATALQDPDPRLTKAAIESVRQWKFQPALDSAGKPVKVTASITVNFKLK